MPATCQIVAEFLSACMSGPTQNDPDTRFLCRELPTLYHLLHYLVAPLTSKYAPSHMSNMSESMSSPRNNRAANRAAHAAMQLKLSSTQETVSTITTAPSGDEGEIDFTGGGDGEESGGEEAAMEESEQLPHLMSVFDCSYIPSYAWQA